MSFINRVGEKVRVYLGITARKPSLDIERLSVGKFRTIFKPSVNMIDPKIDQVGFFGGSAMVTGPNTDQIAPQHLIDPKVDQVGFFGAGGGLDHGEVSRSRRWNAGAAMVTGPNTDPQHLIDPKREQVGFFGAGGGLDHGETARSRRWYTDARAAMFAGPKTDPQHLIDPKSGGGLDSYNVAEWLHRTARWNTSESLFAAKQDIADADQRVGAPMVTGPNTDVKVTVRDSDQMIGKMQQEAREWANVAAWYLDPVNEFLHWIGLKK